MPQSPQLCSQCGHFDADPGSDAGFCEVEMGYRLSESPACESFTLPETAGNEAEVQS